MTKLYFSEKDKVLFWIAGYTEFGQEQNVSEFIAMLEKFATQFSELAKVPKKEVWTFDVHKSSQFLKMRVFYVSNFQEMLQMPPNTVKIKDSMFDFIEY